MISNQQKLFIRWKASDNMSKKSRRMWKLEKLSYKEKYENYRARIDSESYNELTPEQIKRSEEIAKKVEEYGRKLYGKDWLGDKK